MIEYSYCLERDEGDEIKTYKPSNYPTKLDNLVYIEGPNSSGKSTLLNIVALALYGHKKPKLNQALYNKILDLLDVDHQSLKFEVKITNPNNKFEIISRKKNPQTKEIEVILFQNGEKTLLDSDSFHRKFNLIYDIPDNPTDRLDQLTNEIGNIQQNLGSKIGFFRAFLRNTIKDIRNSRDPLKLQGIEKSILEGEVTIKSDEEKLELDIAFLTSIKKYTYSRFYCSYQTQIDKNKANLENLEQAAKEKGKIKRKLTKEMRDLISKISNKKIILYDNYSEATVFLEGLLPSRSKKNLDLWKEINLDDEINLPHFSNHLRKEAKFFIEIIKDIKKEMDRGNKVDEIYFFEELINFLDSYRDSKVKIPGSDKSISELVDLIEEKLKTKESLKVKLENIDAAVEALEGISELRDDLVDLTFKLNELTGEKEQELPIYHDIDNQGQVGSYYSDNIKKFESKKEFYKNKCIKLDISENQVKETYESLKSDNTFKPYLLYNEEQLLDRISELDTETANKNKNIKQKKHSITMLEAEKKMIESKEPHKYQDYLDDLGNYLSIAEKLEQKFKRTYHEYIENLSQRKINAENLSKNENYYYDQVSMFLARKVGFVRHGEVEYEVDRIDQINRKIITKENKRIKFSDLGTGQSQSAYLKGLLNTNDKRRIIALFDEVAMMDDKSLEPIYKKLRQLNKEGKLVCGIVIQMANKEKVISKL